METLLAVVGPTATGKSDLALEIAQQIGRAQVVNADAFQLYRGMDVGTAKVPTSARRGIRHHLIDVLDPLDGATVADYQRAARAAVSEITAAGDRAVVVGGSGLYVRALLDHLEFPGTDPVVRAALEERVAAEGSAALFAELVLKDPVAARTIDPRNTRRVVRALEAIAVSGRPFSATLPVAQYVRPTLVIGLDADRDWLDRRIDQRVDQMWAAGLVDEVRNLASPQQGGIGAGLGATAVRAVGYAQILPLLAGKITAESAKADLSAATRRLARKQMGWFGRDPRIKWLDATDPNLVERALELVEGAENTIPLDAHRLVRRPLGSVVTKGIDAG